MALIFADGCDLYGTDPADAQKRGWTPGATTRCDVEPTAGRFGGGALSVYDEFRWERSVPTVGNGDTIIFHAAVKSADFISNDAFLTFQGSGAYQVGFWAADGNNLAVHNGTIGNTLLGTIAWPHAVWHWIEVKIIVGNPGTVIVRVDGVEKVNSTTEDISGDITSIGLSNGRDGTSSADRAFWDDIIICDGTGTTNNDFLGDSRILTDLPTGDDTTTQWTTSTGTDHYALVDDATGSLSDGDTTYVESGTVANRDDLTYPSLSISPDTIHAVQETCYAKLTTAGTEQLKIVVDSSTTEASSTVSLSTDYQLLSAIFETDPNTSSAWTEANVNSATLGIEVA